METFSSAYKRLLVRHEIKLFEHSNSLADGIDILLLSRKPKSFVGLVIDYEAFDDILCSSDDNDLFDVTGELNSYVENIVDYIAGFVVSKIENTVGSNLCRDKMMDSTKEKLIIKLK